MPSNVLLQNLGELAESISNGTAIPQNTNGIGLPVSRIETLQNNKFDFNRIKYISDISNENINKYKYRDGDIALSHINSLEHVGKTAIYFSSDYPELIHGMNLLRIRLKKEIIDPEYFFYYSLSYYFKNDIVKKIKKAVNQVSINQQNISSLQIPIFPLGKQKQIVSKIKECFTFLDKSEEKLKQAEEKLKKLLDSEMKNLIEVNKKNSNWSTNSVKELSNKIQYGFTAKASNKGNAKMLRITDIQKGKVDWDNVPLIQITSDELAKYKLEKGDILFARSGATAGKSYIYQSDNNEQDVFASYLIRVQTNPNKMVAEYLYQYFQTRSYWDQIMDKVDGTAQPNVNGTKLGEIQIHYPKDLSEQSAIANKLKSLKTDLERVHSNLVATRNRSETLRQSILKKAFEGKLI